jgi:hypothetical protein
MRLVEAISGDHEPAPLVDVVHRIRVPVLLIASNRAGERTIDDAFRRRIGPRAQLWYVGDARHTQALERHARLYEARIGALLDAAVGTPPQRPAVAPAA